jgi:UDP-glucose 4,6-dehydratase
VKGLPNYKFVCGNICSPELVKYVLETEKIDTIMHFAAQTHVDNSFGNSFQFTQNNIMGTHVMLESAKDVGIKRFIHVSTDEVYGEQSLEQAAMDEEQVRSQASSACCLHTFLLPACLYHNITVYV